VLVERKPPQFAGTDGHRGRSEISNYFSPVNARGLLVARAFSIAIDPWPPLFSSDSARRRRRGRLAIRWIEVDAAGDAANTGIIFS
jgi:hypothetical protein